MSVYTSYRRERTITQGNRKPRTRLRGAEGDLDRNPGTTKRSGVKQAAAGFISGLSDTGWLESVVFLATPFHTRYVIMSCNFPL